MTELEEKYSLLQLYYTPKHMLSVAGRLSGMFCANNGNDGKL